MNTILNKKLCNYKEGEEKKKKVIIKYAGKYIL